MPADFPSVLLLILLKSAETMEQLGPYLAGGFAVSWFLFRLTTKWPKLLSRLPPYAATPFAALVGTLSPIPTAGLVPFILQLQARGLTGDVALTFVLSSSLMNPQLFILTSGAFGIVFALAQLAAVLSLSILLGKVFGRLAEIRGERAFLDDAAPPSISRLAEHIGFYFLLGVITGSSLQVLLPWTGTLNWLARHGFLSSPLLGWIGAPFYICMGNSIPLARSLSELGFSWGALFTFLLVGPSLRGITLANLACFLPRRALATCLVVLVIAGGLLGWGFEFVLKVLR